MARTPRGWQAVLGSIHGNIGLPTLRNKKANFAPLKPLSRTKKSSRMPSDLTLDAGNAGSHFGLRDYFLHGSIAIPKGLFVKIFPAPKPSESHRWWHNLNAKFVS